MTQLISDELLEYAENAPRAKTNVSWWDLREFRKIKLDFNFQKHVFTLLLHLFEKDKLKKAISRSPATLMEHTKIHRAIDVKTLKCALRLLAVPLESANNHILEICGIRDPKLPFNLTTPEGAEIRLAFLSDGHVPKNPGKNPKYQAGEERSQERIIKLIKDAFGEMKVGVDKKGRKIQSYFPCVIGDILELTGVSRGMKSKVNPFVPKDILFSSNFVTESALRRSFTDEGFCLKNTIRIERNVDITDLLTSETIQKLPLEKEIYRKNLPHNLLMRPDLRINNLIWGEHLLLKNLGINSKLTPIKIRKNKNGSITLTWRLDVTGIKNIRKFNQLIRFDDKEKNAKVEKILLRFRKYNRYEDCVDAAKHLISKKSSFTYQEFSKIVGVCGNRGLFHLRRLIADGIVVRDSENCYRCTI